MTCELRRLDGFGPTPADLAFHRRLVAQIKESLCSRRLTLAERLQALVDLEHHQQHQTEITTAIYTGQPVASDETTRTGMVALGLTRVTVSTLLAGPQIMGELPTGNRQEQSAFLRTASRTRQPVMVTIRNRKASR